MHFLFVWFVKLTAWIPQLIGLKIRVHYEDKSVQNKRVKGGAIIVSNHHSIMDFAVMMFVFWRRTLRCVVAELMFEKNIFMSLFLRMMGSVKVDRNAHDFSFLEKSAKIIKRGGVVEIYPEARIPQGDEPRPLEFKPSAVYLALETGAPIIPVYNARRSFADKPTNVIIGKPIYMRELYDDKLSEKQNIENLTVMLRGKIIELGEKLKEKTEARD